MPEAAPFPVHGLTHESALDGVAVEIAQLDGELVSVAHVAIIVALPLKRPEFGIAAKRTQALGEGELEKMDGVGERAGDRFADQQVDVFGHDNVSVNEHLEAAAHRFEAHEKQIVALGGAEILLPTITTKGYEVGLSGVVISAKIAGHASNLAHPVNAGSDMGQEKHTLTGGRQWWAQVSVQRKDANLGHRTFSLEDTRATSQQG